MEATKTREGNAGPSKLEEKMGGQSAEKMGTCRGRAAVIRLAKDTYGSQKGRDLSTNTDTDGTDRAGGLPK